MKKFVAEMPYCDTKTALSTTDAKTTSTRVDVLNKIIDILPKLNLDKIFAPSLAQNAQNTQPISQSIQKYSCQNTAKILQSNRENTRILQNNNNTKK